MSDIAEDKKLKKLREALINDSISVHQIANISGLKYHKLNKARKQLIQGLPMPSLDWLQPRRFEWTTEQVAWLTDSDNMLKWGTQSLI